MIGAIPKGVLVFSGTGVDTGVSMGVESIVTGEVDAADGTWVRVSSGVGDCVICVFCVGINFADFVVGTDTEGFSVFVGTGKASFDGVSILTATGDLIRGFTF